MTYDILIADDHPLFRSALRQALTIGLGPEARLVEAESIAQLESRLGEKADWDLVLLDLNMPGAYGFSGLVLLRGQYPQIPVVMVSAQEEASIVVRSRSSVPAGSFPSPARWKSFSRRCAPCSMAMSGGHRRSTNSSVCQMRPKLPVRALPA